MVCYQPENLVLFLKHFINFESFCVPNEIYIFVYKGSGRLLRLNKENKEKQYLLIDGFIPA